MLYVFYLLPDVYPTQNQKGGGGIDISGLPPSHHLLAPDSCRVSPVDQLVGPQAGLSHKASDGFAALF